MSPSFLNGNHPFGNSLIGGGFFNSKLAEVLKEEGYLSSVSIDGEGVKSQVVVVLKYAGTKAVIEGIERVSKSSCRVHCGSREIPRVRNGLGIVVLSTPKGIMSGRKAAQENVGGEILCRVW